MLPVTPRISSLFWRVMVARATVRPIYRTPDLRFKSLGFIECGGPDMAPALPQAADTRSRLVVSCFGLGSDFGRVLFFDAVADARFGDLFEGVAGRLLVTALDLGLGAAVELARALGREHHEHVAVGDVVQGLFQRWERHQAGTSMSGNLRVSRLVRQRSAWMMVASWSTASFTSRLMIR